MIHRDGNGFPVDATYDGGDSAFRHGLLMTFEPTPIHPYTMMAYENNGLMMRHPSDEPWNNPWNFSRDQLMVAITGAYAAAETQLCRRVFYAHAKRFFFCQNLERDIPGSKKYPWPHTFINDRGERESRIFDFADILMPDHVWHLIRCARLWPLYWFAIIGIPWFCLSLFFHSGTGPKEHHQIICQAKVNGKWAVKLFKLLNPQWHIQVLAYWYCRYEEEYARLIIEDLEKT